ncbi:MAG: hypothetical protein HQL31_13915, partial [Planctomycetes bacterium]|nr:hypothetical protein [Planctomycetota bacterium]
RNYGLETQSRNAYAGLAGRAIYCTECGACVPKCPQKIDIPRMLRQVSTELDTEFRGFGTLFALSGFSAEGLRLRLTAKNLSSDARTICTRMELDENCHAEPKIVDFGLMEAGTIKSATTTLSVKDGQSCLSGLMVTLSGEESRETPLRLPFFMVPSGDQLRWHKAHIPPEAFARAPEFLSSHGYRVGLRHDGRKILVELEIRSALYGLGPAGSPTGARIEMYVDMRPEDAGLGSPSYSEGAEQFFLGLDPAGGLGSKSGKAYNLHLRNEKRPEGVRITLELPFALFCGAEAPLPRCIGLDFMFVVCDAKGVDLGYPTYGGKANLYSNPAAFTPAGILA